MRLLAGMRLSLVVGVLSCPLATRAETETVRATTSGGTFAMEVVFQPERLYAGNGSVDLDVVVTSERGMPKLVKATSDDAFMSVQKLLPGQSTQSAGLQKQGYLLTIGLRPNVEPRAHEIAFEFQPASGSEPARAYAKLPIGVVNNGMLAAKLDGEAVDVGLLPGERPFNVLFTNTFPEYDVYLNRIEVSASPDYLVHLESASNAHLEAGVATFETPFVVRALSRVSLPISLRVRSPDITGALRGVSNPNLSLRFTYTDGHGRQISDLKIDKPVKPPVAIAVALAAVIVGLLLGLLIAGATNSQRSTRATAATIAAALVIIVCVISGHLQFSIFEAKWDYGSAVALFVLSAAAVVGGAPNLTRWLKLGPQQGGQSSGGSAGIALVVGLSLLSGSAQAKTKAAKAEALAPEALLQRGAFYLDVGKLAEAQKDLVEAGDKAPRGEAERAFFLLGTLNQRKYYTAQEKTGQRDWAALYDSEAAFRRSQALSAAETGWTWLADSAFNIALIEVERGASAQARAAVKALGDSAQRDGRVHVYQVVWSSVAASVIDADFTTNVLFDVLRLTVEDDPKLGAPALARIVTALKDQKVVVARAGGAEAKAKPLVAVAVPHASAKETGTKGGAQYYEFYLSLNVPEERRGEIKEVDYKLDHPTFKKQNYVSNNSSNNFAVGYKGWGALSRVDIKIVRKDGKEEAMTFDMLADLGWQ